MQRRKQLHLFTQWKIFHYERRTIGAMLLAEQQELANMNQQTYLDQYRMEREEMKKVCKQNQKMMKSMLMNMLMNMWLLINNLFMHLWIWVCRNFPSKLM